MMKKLLLAVVLFSTCVFTVSAKECRSESDWAGYFAERLDVLDPLEGIYDIQFLINQTSHDGKCAIARVSGNLFAMYSLSGNELGYYFERVGLTNVYYLTTFYDAKVQGIKETSVFITLLAGIQTEYKSVAMQIRNRFTLTEGGFVFEYNSPAYNLDWYIAYMGISALKIYPDAYTVQTQKEPSCWSGSCFALGQGYLATNHHVAGEAAKMKIYDDATGKVYPATLVATDPVNDLSVIKVSDPSFVAAGKIPYTLKSEPAKVAEHCFILGFPKPGLLGRELKYTDGTVTSWSGISGNSTTYQISAPATNGNSGGPTFDDNGNVIGILSSGIPSLENVSYSIKAQCLYSLLTRNGLQSVLAKSTYIPHTDQPSLVEVLRKYVFYIECTSSDWSSAEVKSASKYIYELPRPKQAATSTSTTNNSSASINELIARNEKRLDRVTDNHKEALIYKPLCFWPHMSVSMKTDLYTSTLYKQDEASIRNTLLPIFIDAYNRTFPGQSVLAEDDNSPIKAVFEILEIDDDGDVEAIVTISDSKGEVIAEIYVDGDGGNCSKPYQGAGTAVRQCGTMFAKKLKHLAK